MTVAYFDCFSGISGDMTLGALLDGGADRAVLDAAVEAMGLGDEVTIDVRRESRGHAAGTRVVVGHQVSGAGPRPHPPHPPHAIGFRRCGYLRTVPRRAS